MFQGHAGDTEAAGLLRFDASTQKSAAPTGMAAWMILDWLLPRLPNTPGLRNGKVVKMVEASPFFEP
jgi:ammonia channel protein AmtB